MIASSIAALRPVYVIGGGWHPYRRASDATYVELGLTAIRGALADAGVEWTSVQSAYVAHTRLGMAAGRPLIRHLGVTGVPVVQVENASASGSAAFRQAMIDVGSGMSDVSVAVGVDKPERLRTGPERAGLFGLIDDLVRPVSHFALIAERYMNDTGATPVDLARVAEKNLLHASHNPNAHRRIALSVDEILNARHVSGVLTVPQCTPVCEGAAAVVVCSAEAIERFGIDKRRAIRVLGAVAGSELESNDLNPDLTLSKACADALYESTGVGPGDVDVLELHEAFSIEELVYLEAMGFVEPGKAAPAMAAGEFNVGGACAVSTSGGLIGMGHPIGPTGIGQIAHIAQQLRGTAGVVQQPDARIGVAHMVGVGVVCFMHMLTSEFNP